MYDNRALDVRHARNSAEDSTVRFIPALPEGQVQALGSVTKILNDGFGVDGLGIVRLTDEIHYHCNTRSDHGMTRFYKQIASTVPLYEFQFAPGGRARKEVWIWRARDSLVDGTDHAVDPRMVKGLLKVRVAMVLYANKALFENFRTQMAKLKGSLNLSASAQRVLFEFATGEKVPRDGNGALDSGNYYM